MGNYIIVLDRIGVDQVLVRNNWEKFGKGNLQPKVNSKRDGLRSIGVVVRAVASRVLHLLILFPKAESKPDSFELHYIHH